MILSVTSLFYENKCLDDNKGKQKNRGIRLQTDNEKNNTESI